MRTLSERDDVEHILWCHSTIMMGVTNLFPDYGGAFLMYISVEGSEY